MEVKEIHGSSQTRLCPDGSEEVMCKKTVVSVMTDDHGAMQNIKNGFIDEHTHLTFPHDANDRAVDESAEGIAIPESVIQEAMAQIVFLNKENEEEVIEVDVELDGDDPPPDFFSNNHTDVDEVVQKELLSSLSKDNSNIRTEADGESVDVICGKCGKHFHDIDALQWHLRLHSRIKSFIAASSTNRYAKNHLSCPECELTFAKYNDLIKHAHSYHTDLYKEYDHSSVKMEIENDDVPFNFAESENISITCEFCEQTFSNVDLLQTHVENNHSIVKNETNTEKSECGSCAQNFSTPYILQRHLETSLCGSTEQNGEMKAQSAKQTVIVSSDLFDDAKTCRECDETFVSFDLLKQHLENYHGQLTGIDDSIDNIMDGQDFELIEVADEKPLIIQIIKDSNYCKVCNKTFSDVDDLQRHESSHFEDKTYTCQECDEVFPTYFSMLGHMRIHHVNGDTELLVCKKCGKSFSNEDDLEEHIQDHSKRAGRRKFPCPVCRKTFTHKHSLKNHMPLHHGMGEHKCPECDKLFPCASSLNRHIKIHSSEKQYFCDACDKGFKDSYALKKHIRIHSSDRPYVCQECGSSFRTQSTLSAHTVVHTKIKPFPCKECGKKFSFRSDLNRHMKLHSGVRQHKCDQCSKAFFEKSRLVIHKRIHTGEKPFSCSECGDTFISSRNLARHMKIHNPAFICTVCSKTYVDAYTLKIHMYKHTGERPHACDQCSKRFRTPALLKKHALTHTGIKPFVCEDCGRGFTSALNLKNHTTLHTGDRPFQCPECEKCFPTESTLKVHMQFHGEKAYFCQQCGKSFHRIYELNLHAITHAPEKPYSCDLCSKSFCHKATYKAHMNTHTEETKYPCPQCKKIFLRSNTLRKHMKTHMKSQSRAQAVGNEPTAYLCTECGSTFTPIDVLRKHLAEVHGCWREDIVSEGETELIVEEITEQQVEARA